MFGLLLFENILPGTIKIAQSGHTGIDREHFWAELNPLRYVDEWKLDLWITVWPDLAKFRHFGKKLSLWQFFKGIFSIWRHLELIMTGLSWTNLVQLAAIKKKKSTDLFDVSSVVSSGPTILQQWVWIPSTPSRLFQFVLLKKYENKHKEARFGPFKKWK